MRRAASAFLMGLLLPLAAYAGTGEPDAGMAVPAVQEGGRVKPLDTLAREFFQALTGSERFRSPPAGASEGTPMEPLPADRVMALLRLVALDEERLVDLPLFPVLHEELRARLDVPRAVRFVSVRKVRGDPDNTLLANEVATALRSPDTALTPLQAKWRELDRRIESLRILKQEGGALFLVPPRGVCEGAWGRLTDPAPGEDGEEEADVERIRAAAGLCLQAAFRTDEAAWRDALAALASAQAARAGPSWPAAALGREARYHRVAPYRIASWGYLAACLASLAAVWTRRGALRAASLVLLVSSLGLHLYGFVLRWMFQGHVPLSNLYEALAMMSAGVALWAFVLECVFRSGWISLVASLLASGILALVHAIPVLNPHPDVILPALQSWWMRYHVSCMVIGGYGGGGVAFGLAHLYLLSYLFRPSASAFRASLERHLYWAMTIAVTCIGIGLCLGAAWANEAWGRYWGWDPKETWGLVTLLGYVLFLHLRLLGVVRGLGMACGALFGFALVMMTVYGVNLIGKGLHAYGFFEGGWGPLFGFYSAEAALVGACGVASYVREKGTRVPGTRTPDAGRRTPDPGRSAG
ncbi:MAG: cytochrome c biogenesis protein CcsA [Planctomycetes bacterium]|nr:cytochrome c biogenesis protein CcsA [Planctomycetota bacterium]